MTSTAISGNNRNLEDFAFSLSRFKSTKAVNITRPATRIWYFARNPTPTAMPHKTKVLLTPKRNQEKKKNNASEKKKTNAVSNIAALESQKKPGVTPSTMLAIRAVFGPYVRFANSNTTHIDNREN